MYTAHSTVPIKENTVTSISGVHAVWTLSNGGKKSTFHWLPLWPVVLTVLPAYRLSNRYH